MRRASCCFLVALLSVGLPSCEPRDTSSASDVHSHAASSVVSVTHWTDRSELFMEHPSLVAGQRVRAAIHVTDLDGFSPLGQGETTVTLRSAEGRVLQFRGGASSPGIFGVDLVPDATGVYEMDLKIDAPSLQDIHRLGPVTVYAAGEAPSAAATAMEEEISFLKEQQWTLDFGTAAAESRSLRSSVTVPAAVEPRAGGEVTLTAPVPGRIAGSTVPVPGAAIHAGDVVARILPRPGDLRDADALRAELVEAEQEHGLAVQGLARTERLVEARALPARRLDEATAELRQAKARLTAAQRRWDRFAPGGVTGEATALEVRAPFTGVVFDVRISPGTGVEEGQPLLRIVDPNRVHVVGSVPESSAAILHSVDGGELLIEDGSSLSLAAPLAIGRVVDPRTRTLEIRFALDNVARLPVGRSVDLRLFVGGSVAGTAVPETAIVDDGGRPVVFVQTGGESFARRPVRLGARAGGWVHVVEGVETGERVVHVGAYLIRLAAMSSQIPSHGHVH